MAWIGTTGYVAKMLKRSFTMIEKKQEYVKAIVKRLNKQYI
jgi:DNA modification methylase